jgi:hypothetical protein
VIRLRRQNRHAFFLKDASLEEYHDTVLLNGLRLAASDSRLGHLDEERLERILATVAELTNELDAHDDVADVEPVDSTSPLTTLAAIEQPDQTIASPPEEWKVPRSILCIPGLGMLDEAAALCLAQILRRRGYGATAEQADALSMSKFFALDLLETSLVCICYVERPSSARIHYAVRRIGRKRSEAAIFVALLGEDQEAPAEASGATVVEGPFKTIIEAIVGAVESISLKRSVAKTNPPLVGIELKA